MEKSHVISEVYMQSQSNSTAVSKLGGRGKVGVLLLRSQEKRVFYEGGQLVNLRCCREIE